MTEILTVWLLLVFYIVIIIACVVYITRIKRF